MELLRVVSIVPWDCPIVAYKGLLGAHMVIFTTGHTHLNELNWNTVRCATSSSIATTVC